MKELSPAESAKEDGNAAFKKGDLPAALTAYTQALEKDPTMLVAANNRAMVNIRMQQFGDAEKDCNMVCGEHSNLQWHTAALQLCSFALGGCRHLYHSASLLNHHHHQLHCHLTTSA